MVSLTEENKERQDFPKWAVETVYIAQDGICSCGNPLSYGFRRHHKNGDASDNSVENCELKCVECHFATYVDKKLPNPLVEHRKQEQKILDKLNILFDQIFSEKPISGAHMERLLDAMAMSLKVSRSINKIDREIEHPPAVFTMIKRLQEGKVLYENYLEGMKNGIALGFSNVVSVLDNVKKKELKFSK